MHICIYLSRVQWIGVMKESHKTECGGFLHFVSVETILGLVGGDHTNWVVTEP